MARKKTSQSAGAAANDKARNESDTAEAKQTDKATVPEQSDEKDLKVSKEKLDESKAEGSTDPLDEKPVADAEPKLDDGKAAADEPSSEVAASRQDTEGSFLPMMLGGIAAGAVGFAAAFFGIADKPDPAIPAIASQIESLQSVVDENRLSLDSIAQTVDSEDTPSMAAIEELQASISELTSRLGSTEEVLNNIDTRLTTLEKRPVTEGASDEAVAAYERELKAAKEDFAHQRAALEELIANAVNTEEAAEDAADAAMRRAGISRVLSALESGAPFDAAVADLQTAGAEVPEELSNVSSQGVTTTAELQQAFPEAARAALAAARRTQGGSEGETGFSGFLRDKLGVRSLEPREGNDPDAILSRAEAATREGRLSDALSEIDSLPEAAKAELADWVSEANGRLEALRAAQSLSETVK